MLNNPHAYFAKHYFLPWLIPENSFELIAQALKKLDPKVVDDKVQPFVDSILANYQHEIGQLDTKYTRLESRIQRIMEMLINANIIIVTYLDMLVSGKPVDYDEINVQLRRRRHEVIWTRDEYLKTHPNYDPKHIDLYKYDIKFIYLQINKDIQEEIRKNRVMVVNDQGMTSMNEFGLYKTNPPFLTYTLGACIIETDVFVNILSIVKIKSMICENVQNLYTVNKKFFTKK